MREGTFIDRNVKRWEDIESDAKTDPDEVSSDFIDLMNDLSYAQTHYPHSKINAYVNSLSSRVYKKIFLHQKQGKNPFYYFWVRDFPAVLGHNANILWLATTSFLAFCILGYICSTLDPSFVEAILGADYVKMTEENIRKGEPFGVYSSTSPLNMFLRIFSNNLWVGLILFVSGIGLGVGTVYFTFTNGIMVGAFLSLFVANNLGTDAVFVIMLHGTFELMGLVLECMAGLILGLSFIFPGTLTRKQAFYKGLNESVKIYLGTVPFTILAAVIESYVTYLGKGGFQNSNIFTMIFLAAIFVGSWAVVIWYFFIYSKKQAEVYPYAKYLEGIVNK